MTISRNIDEQFAKKRFIDVSADLSEFLTGARRDPKNLDLLIRRAWSEVSCGHTAKPQSSEIPKALRIAAEAYAALFAAASSTGGVTVQLGEGEPVTYNSVPDASTVNAGAWILGFYFNVLHGDVDSMNRLAQVPLDVVRRSPTKAGEYYYLYMQALQQWTNNDMGSIVKTMLAAVKATDPDRPDVFNADWTLNLHVPQLEVLIYVVTKDARFGEALVKAVRLHKKYWEKTKDRRRDYIGFVAVELTALAVMGRSQGLSFDVESPYLALDLVK
jgi:immunity protein 49 of polymorphic toxin system